MARRSLSEALELARTHSRNGRWDLCAQLCEAIVQADPLRHEALHLAGVARHQRADLPGALEYFRRAAELQPHNPQYQTNLGAVCDSLGDRDRAAECFSRALELDPRSTTARYNLANILQSRGRLDEAEAAYRQVLAERPDSPAALLNFAGLLSGQERHYEAQELLERALTLVPDSPHVLSNLGILYRDLGRFADAEACYRNAIRSAPAMAEAHSNLAGLLKEHGRMPEAEAEYQEALRLRPDFAEALAGLGGLYRERADLARAAECYHKAMRLSPNPLARLEHAVLLPAIYASAEQIRRRRSELVAELTRLVADRVRLDLCHSTPHTLFYLAYQGLNDRPVHELVARIADAGPDAAPRRRPQGTRPRIGFVSKVLIDHTIGQLWQNMIAGLSPKKFEVFVWSPAVDDPVTRRIRARADHWAMLSGRPSFVRRQIAEAGLDVLVYPEVGMDPGVWALASQRLAPVQCVGWGHPVTTGFPAIDYFLSSRLMETADADQHYTEQLVRSERFGLCLDRPQLSRPASRADFGLPEDRHLYGCLQSLFKIHPDDDAQLAEVLRRDPAGELVLLEGTAEVWRRDLLERLKTSMPDVLPRVRFLPRQTDQDYLRLCSLMDVMLDPIHFSGGRTSYEALALGVPVVTLPSGLLRGRITLGIYRAMGVDDCVASDRTQYVDLAVRLAGDTDFRRSVRDKILAGCDRFFNDRSAITEFEAFLLRVVK